MKIQCFRASPYCIDEDVFLQIEQIIPLPETKQYMVEVREKEKEEIVISKTVVESESRLIKFWGLLKVKVDQSGFRFLDNVSAGAYSYIAFYKGNGAYGYCIGRKGYRVELYFPEDADKVIIEKMLNYKDEIDQKFDGEIEWERLEGKIASRIKFETKLDEMNFRDETTWEALIDWYNDSMVKFYNVINPIWEKVQKEL